MTASTPLLCELHAHTTWSDGVLPLRSVVDLYGAHGFDVLCVTDHVVRSAERPRCVTRQDHAAYLAEIELEAVRARSQYGLLLLPGLELTLNDPDLDRAAHAVAVGLREFVDVDQGIDRALLEARAAGAALIAAHPLGAGAFDHRGTRAFWTRFDELAGLVDRWELVNRHQVFGWIAEARLPAVASGDFHKAEHLSTWKTLLPCEPNEEAIVGFLRSEERAYLAEFEPAAPRVAA